MDDWKLKVWVAAQFANKHTVHKPYKCYQTIHSQKPWGKWVSE